MPAGLRHHVQRGHHQAGAVAQHPDVAVELDVGEAALLGHLLLGVLGGGIAQLRVLRVAEQPVAVQRDLGVERHHVALGGHDQRVDLDQHRLLAHERLVQAAQQLAHRADDVGVHPGGEGQPPGVEVLEAQQRVDVQAGDRRRVIGRHLLDVHSAPGGQQHQRSLARAVEHDRRVVLRRDVRRALDPQLVHDVAADVHAEDRLGMLARLRPVVGDLDSP